jgi:hypothetical protein
MERKGKNSTINYRERVRLRKGQVFEREKRKE